MATELSVLFHYAISQAVGGRDSQEDCCAVRSQAEVVRLCTEGTLGGRTSGELVAVLCDGMGGHNAGEIAAQIAATSFLKSMGALLLDGHIYTSEALLLACEQANQALAQERDRNAALNGMGTTLVGVWCADSKLNWVSIGDSHLLLLRDKHLIKLNQDHSMRPILREMVRRELISSDESSIHPDRNALRSVLNGDQPAIIDGGVESLRLRRNDVLLIASDGIDQLPSQAVVKILQSTFSTLRNRARKIVSAAVNIGGSNQDNTTVMLVRVDQLRSLKRS